MNVVLDLRNRAGLTQALLAKFSGTSTTVISRYETGERSPTLAMLNSLAAAAGFDVVVSFVPTRSGEDRQPRNPPPDDRAWDPW
jgi:transcriptional regulator with XRE-family HTH domain